MKIDDFGPWRQFSSVNDRTERAKAPVLYYPVSNDKGQLDDENLCISNPGKKIII